MPRGYLQRELRNRGMDLCLRRAATWSETPDVAVEYQTKGRLAYTIYHTPVGTVRAASHTHVGRISDDEIERQFKDGMRAIMDAIHDHRVY